MNKKSESEQKNKKRVLMKPGKTNREDRLNFVKFWAEYVRTHGDEEWSRQQNVIINSQIRYACENKIACPNVQSIGDNLILPLGTSKKQMAKLGDKSNTHKQLECDV